MKAIILKTKPYSMFRLGSGSLNETDRIIHSDTLFSGLISIHSQVFDNTEQFINLFANGAIIISSAFPMLTNKGDNKNIYFLPKPELNYNTDKNIKEEKEIKFISIESYKYLLNHVQTTDRLNISFTDKNYFSLIGSSFAVTKIELGTDEKLNGFISEVVTPKTKVHSPTQEDSFYHQTDIQVNTIEFVNDKVKTVLYPHFYFLYELNCPEKEQKEFITCLRILADEGIGGERSSGKGQLEKVIETEIDVEIDKTSNKKLLLSLCNPNTQDEFDSFEHYDIIIRGGGSVSFDSEDDKQESEIKPYRKKQVRMIAEGAVLNGNVKGKLVDISPGKGADHKYFRNGKCFTIPLG